MHLPLFFVVETQIRSFFAYIRGTSNTMDPFQPLSHSTFICCKICLRMLLFTYKNNAMCYDISYYWQSLSSYAPETHQFSFALTDCKLCQKNEEIDSNEDFEPNISEHLLGGPINYAARLAKNRGSDLQCSTTFSSLVLFLHVASLFSHFPREHTVRSVAPEYTRSHWRADEAFSVHIDTYCKGWSSCHTLQNRCQLYDRVLTRQSQRRKAGSCHINRCLRGTQNISKSQLHHRFAAPASLCLQQRRSKRPCLWFLGKQHD